MQVIFAISLSCKYSQY